MMEHEGSKSKPWMLPVRESHSRDVKGMAAPCQNVTLTEHRKDKCQIRSR